MPKKPKRPCSYPGCSKLTDGRFCEEHAKLEAKRLCLVRNKPTDAVSLVLIQFRKGAKPGLRWEELCLQDAKGDPTEAYKKIYHL